MYSFAWIVDDILCAIKKEKQQTNTKRPSAVLLRIGESVHEEFLNASFRLESVIAAKEDILKCIKSEIERVAGKECFTVTAYGSVSMYLCEQESDLDVCLSPCKAAYDKYAPKGRRLCYFWLASVLGRTTAKDRKQEYRKIRTYRFDLLYNPPPHAPHASQEKNQKQTDSFLCSYKTVHLLYQRTLILNSLSPRSQHLKHSEDTYVFLYCLIILV